MIDEFEFTLHSPLTKEDWEKISDAELENTKSITFQTPQGRQVKYIKCEVLDEIKADIEQTTSRYCLSIEHSALGHVVWSDRLIKESEVLEIIDKYKAEGSGEE